MVRVWRRRRKQVVEAGLEAKEKQKWKAKKNRQWWGKGTEGKMDNREEEEQRVGRKDAISQGRGRDEAKKKKLDLLLEGILL